MSSETGPNVYMLGIVSSITFSCDYSGLFAAASLSAAITLFTEASGADPVVYLDGMSNAITQVSVTPILTLSFASSECIKPTGLGILFHCSRTFSCTIKLCCWFQSSLARYLIATDPLQVKFDPYKPHLLYAAQRRSSELLCWDVREPHEVLRRFRTPGPRRTNQKSLFDIDPAGRWLCTGEEARSLRVFCRESSAENELSRMAMCLFLICRRSQKSQCCISRPMGVSLYSFPFY